MQRKFCPYSHLDCSLASGTDHLCGISKCQSDAGSTPPPKRARTSTLHKDILIRSCSDRLFEALWGSDSDDDNSDEILTQFSEKITPTKVAAPEKPKASSIASGKDKNDDESGKGDDQLGHSLASGTDHSCRPPTCGPCNPYAVRPAAAAERAANRAGESGEPL